VPLVPNDQRDLKIPERIKSPDLDWGSSMKNSPFIVGIRFQKIGKVYHFDASQFRELSPGDYVVVETSRGKQMGEVVQSYEAPPAPPPEGSWKPVERLATPRDLLSQQMWQKKELEATINCRAKLSDLRIRGVKIVAAEFSFDGSRLAFLYSSESGDKVDLNQLRGAMQRVYTKTRVEMRQIGPRDVAKILGGMGACGLETRCCSKFLTEFSPVSIKMAKEQGISLTPSEISGMCGRLRCCLVYEYEQYVEARKELPKRGKRVVTPLGEGKVLDTYPFKQSVLVDVIEKGRHEFMKHELQPWDELEALRRKSQAPCDRHENGGCDCGKDRANGQQTVAEADADVTMTGESTDSPEWDDLLGIEDTDNVLSPPEKNAWQSGRKQIKEQPDPRKDRKKSPFSQPGSGKPEEKGDQKRQKPKSKRPFRRRGKKTS
jgi:cell fate regulator YaaT (PSP1 superfamily)